MLTVLLVGSTATRTFAHGGATPHLHPAGVRGRSGSRNRSRGQARAMTVHFIGAGPGDPDLITVRGRRPHRVVPGGPLRGLARAAGSHRLRPGGRAGCSTPRP